MSVWFTADTHFGHTNILAYTGRPWPTVEAMDDGLIAAWNARVGVHDDVWHLGDFAFRSNVEHYVKRLKGRIHLVYGNHDDPKSLRHLSHRFASMQDVKYLRIAGQRFYLSHYAHRVWRNSHHGSYHLYGHSHGDLPGQGRSMDVGVDAVGYAPLLLEDIVQRLRDADPVLHHLERSPDVHD